jgi:hypothetical protein
MKAILKPLKRRYYGTIVEIVDGPYAGHEITVWISVGDCDLQPSKRELDFAGITQDQWNTNPQVGTWPMETPDYCDGKPGQALMARDQLGICDTHFEGRIAYEAALGLIEVLKGIKSEP